MNGKNVSSGEGGLNASSWKIVPTQHFTVLWRRACTERSWRIHPATLLQRFVLCLEFVPITNGTLCCFQASSFTTYHSYFHSLVSAEWNTQVLRWLASNKNLDLSEPFAKINEFAAGQRRCSSAMMAAAGSTRLGCRNSYIPSMYHLLLGAGRVPNIEKVLVLGSANFCEKVQIGITLNWRILSQFFVGILLFFFCHLLPFSIYTNYKKVIS